MSLARLRARFDWPLFLVALAIVSVGVVNVWSASIRRTEGGEVLVRPFYLKQLVWLGVSLGGFALALLVPYHRLGRRAVWALYLLGLLMLGAVFVFGVTRGGARRWLDLKVLLWQPSEYTKLLVVLALAKYLQFRRDLHRFRVVLISLVLVLVPVALIARQPDLGTALAHLPLWAAMLYAAGARARHLGLVLLAALPTAIAALSLLRPYQRERITAFLDPDHPAGYHQRQGEIALASGQFSGRGWAQGTQNTLGFLPERHTDFIFSVLGEEWGFLGCALLLVLFLAFFARALALAARTRERMGRLVLVGVAAMFATQVFINVGMTLRLMPVTGLTLPFVSYGGSSLLACFLGLGLMINVAIHHPPVIGREDPA